MNRAYVFVVWLAGVILAGMIIAALLEIGRAHV